MGGFSGETGSLTPQYFDFSVKDDAVGQKLTQAVKTGQRVTLHYEEKILRLPWNGETKYYITDVEFIGGPQNSYGQPFGNQSQQMQPGMQQPQQTQPMQTPEPQTMPADSTL